MRNEERDLREFLTFLSQFNRKPDPEKLAELRWYMTPESIAEEEMAQSRERIRRQLSSPYRDEEFEAHLNAAAEAGVSEQAAREMPWCRVDETREHMPELKRRMKCIYVAGPYRAPTPEGIRYNIESVSAFARWLTELTWQHGVFYVVPHLLTTGIDNGQPDDYWLAATMEKLRRCDAIVMFAGFERSKGSMAELAEAQRLGKRVFYHNDPRLVAEIRAWGRE